MRVTLVFAFLAVSLTAAQLVDFKDIDPSEGPQISEKARQHFEEIAKVKKLWNDANSETEQEQEPEQEQEKEQEPEEPARGTPVYRSEGVVYFFEGPAIDRASFEENLKCCSGSPMSQLAVGCLLFAIVLTCISLLIFAHYSQQKKRNQLVHDVSSLKNNDNNNNKKKKIAIEV